MSTVTLTIDGREIQAEQGDTVLETAKKAGIHIPTLCYLEEINEIGACRVCVVEVEGGKALQTACTTPVAEGMKIKTASPAVRHARKIVVELLLSDHPSDCLKCIRNQNCELQSLADDLGIREIHYEGERNQRPIDDLSASVVRDPEKCINCRRCISTCNDVQNVYAYAMAERGFKSTVTPVFEEPLSEVACTNCGQCILACPTGALHEKDETEKVWEALADPEKHVVVQTAPSARVSIGEEVGMEPGSLVTGKLVAALRRIGFDRVFDTDFTADLTILEEGHEFLQRLEEGGTLPMITSCSPGWVKYIEHFYPDYLDHLSTAKSPQQMFGTLAKTFYAEEAGIDPKDIVSVSIMPCTAKKFEANRPEMGDSEFQDVDVVLTNRELGRMFREAGVKFEPLPDEEYDNPLGISTGAGLIFGSSGGVMEAALRTVYEVLTGETLEKLDFEGVRGLEGIKECSVLVGDLEVKVAVANGLGNAHKLMELISEGKADYHFIEIMACPGGCIGGGGQPIPTNQEIKEKRMAAIYSGDKGMKIRKSHESPAIKEIYEKFLGEPIGEKSHKLLHTLYTKRSKFPKLEE